MFREKDCFFNYSVLEEVRVLWKGLTTWNVWRWSDEKWRGYVFSKWSDGKYGIPGNFFKTNIKLKQSIEISFFNYSNIEAVCILWNELTICIWNTWRWNVDEWRSYNFPMCCAEKFQIILSRLIYKLKQLTENFFR